METIKEIVCRNCKRILDKSQNLSEIARLMKINPTTISRWKSGHHAPELDKIDKLAEILNINPLEFYRTNEAPAEPVSKTLIKMSAIPDKIYDIAPDIGKDHKIWKDVLDILKGAKEDTPKSKAASKA